MKYSELPDPLPPWRRRPRVACEYCRQPATYRYVAADGRHEPVPGGIEVTYDPARSVLLCGSNACHDKAWDAWDTNDDFPGMTGIPLRYSWPRWSWMRFTATRLGLWFERKLYPESYPPDDGSPSVYI